MEFIDRIYSAILELLRNENIYLEREGERERESLWTYSKAASGIFGASGTSSLKQMFGICILFKVFFETVFLRERVKLCWRNIYCKYDKVYRISWIRAISFFNRTLMFRKYEQFCFNIWRPPREAWKIYNEKNLLRKPTISLKEIKKNTN